MKLLSTYLRMYKKILLGSPNLGFTMSSIQPLESTSFDSRWHNLYLTACISALSIAILIPLQVIIFILYPPPSTVVDWFALFQSNKLIGLLDLDLLLIIDQILFGLILLALFIKLQHTEKSFSLIAFIIGIMGIISYFSSTIAFEMMSLSDQYTSATNQVEKNNLVTAGQTLIVRWTGTSFVIGYLLLGISFLIMGFIMLRSSDFSKFSAYLGIISGILSLIPASFGTIGLIFAFSSLITIELWCLALSRRFYQFGKRR